jgi:AraC-like DNA-binding protein
VYRERPSRLKGAIVWQRQTIPGDVRILPDGCMDLIWSSGGRLFVAGPDTRAHIFTSGTSATMVGIRFAPGMGPLILGIPAHELRDQRLPLEAIWRPADARRLAELIADSPHPGRSLESAAEDRLHVADASAAMISEIVRLLRSGRSVAAVGSAVGLSERQLHRRSVDAFGYGPKTLARILRLGRAVDLARAGLAFAEVADISGYADQAHLAREARSLAGVPLTLLSR